MAWKEEAAENDSPAVHTRRCRPSLIVGLLGTAAVLIAHWRPSPFSSIHRHHEASQRLLGGFELEPYKAAPRPVFLMHGLQAYAGSMVYLKAWIEAIPGHKAYAIPMYEGRDSWTSLLKQIPDIADYIRNFVKQSANAKTFENGYDLVCFSQGAVICRVLVEYMDDHQVHTLIAMAGPQMGAWGDKVKLNSGLGHMLLKADLGSLIYLPLLQKSNSVANLWNDPNRQEEYLANNLFMPRFNGLTHDPEGNKRRKANFLRLRKAVFLVGDFGTNPWDGSIEPWKSAIWGYYKENSTKEFVSMKDTEVYMDDTIGLRTLDETKRLVAYSVKGIAHPMWIGNYSVFKAHILPHLAGD